MMVINTANYIVVAAACCSLGTTTANADPPNNVTETTIRTVAFAGGGLVNSDQTLDFIKSSPVINDSGQVSFVSTVFEDIGSLDSLIVEGTSGGLYLAAQAFQQAPGYADGRIFERQSVGSPFRNIVLDNRGVVTFAGEVSQSVPGDGSQGIFSYNTQDGILTPLVIQGTPNTATALEGDTFRSAGTPRTNSSGAVVFEGDRRTPSDNFAGQVLAVRSPDGSFNTVHDGPGLGLINDSGNVALRALEFYNSATENTGTVIQQGSGAPGYGPGFTIGAISTFSLNNHNQIAFTGNVTGSIMGVFLTGDATVLGGGVNSIDRIVDGSDLSFDFELQSTSFNSIALNDREDIVLSSSLKGAGVDTSSDTALLFKSSGQDLELVVREGDSVSGLAGDVVIRSAPSWYSLGRGGDLAFSAELRDVSTGEYEGAALFAKGLNSSLEVIAQTGELFDVNDDPLVTELKEIMQINFAREFAVQNTQTQRLKFGNSGGSDGLSRAINESGEIVFTLRFTDQSTGVYVATIPGSSQLFGDYNADGFVSQGDLDLVLLNWGASVVPAEWLATDQFDGVQVSQNKLDGVLLNWGSGTPPSVAIPEPASLTTLSATLAITRRRRSCLTR